MEKRKVKIYYTSDVHGYFYPTSYGDREVKQMGLFACASEYKKDDDTLVIDGGDMLQGSAYATTAEIFLEAANILHRW